MSYKRILLKVSGEALMGSSAYGINIETVDHIAKDIKQIYDTGVQICLVIGGGNIFRGMRVAEQGMDRATADYMGMLATVMNALAMQNALERLDVPTRIQSAIQMTSIAEPYVRRRAIRHMEKGRVIIFAAGTGNPFFTTDTAASLRAIEMNCDALFKGTQVDGIYSADPKKDKNAHRYEEIDYRFVLENDLRVMDLTAVSLAGDNNLPLVVFNIHEHGNLLRVFEGKGLYTLVKNN